MSVTAYLGAAPAKAARSLSLSSPPSAQRAIGEPLIPAAMIAALVVNDTFAAGKDLVLDARAAGVAAAALAAGRRAPLIVVVVIGAAVTAAVRQLG